MGRTAGAKNKIKDSSDREKANEEKFLSDLIRDYNYWNRQPGDAPKEYAAAYRALINEFTTDQPNE